MAATRAFQKNGARVSVKAKLAAAKRRMKSATTRKSLWSKSPAPRIIASQNATKLNTATPMMSTEA